MTRIEQIRTRRQQAHRQLLDMKSKVYEAFLKVEAATYADGALSRKAKELIAIGVSVVMDCESCMEWHITQAAKAGATPREVRYRELRFKVGAPGQQRVIARGQTITLSDLTPNGQAIIFTTRSTARTFACR